VNFEESVLVQQLVKSLEIQVRNRRQGIAHTHQTGGSAVAVHMSVEDAQTLAELLKRIP
jgi:hypothetical protein